MAGSFTPENIPLLVAMDARIAILFAVLLMRKCPHYDLVGEGDLRDKKFIAICDCENWCSQQPTHLHFRACPSLQATSRGNALRWRSDFDMVGDVMDYPSPRPTKCL